MILEYIVKEETVILAVVPANVDIATTEALQMAKEVDREGRRTLGVVTKPDLVDRGAEEEVSEVVTNARYPLRRGYTLVKCRGQQAISSGTSLRDSLEDELRFFNNHPQFSNIPGKLLGMQNLSKKLTRVLVEHIEESLPALKADVREKLERVNGELARLGDGLPTDRSELMVVLTRNLQSFTEAIGKVRDGDTRLDDDKTHELNPYKKARTAFSKFADEVIKIVPRENDQRFIQKLKERIQATRGRELPRFTSFQACEELIKEITALFLHPAKVCLAEVNDVIFEILNQVSQRTVGQYRDLDRAVKERIHDMQHEAMEKCNKELDKIFKQESLVYTQDRTYSATYDSVLEIKHNDQAQLNRPKQPLIPQSVKNMTLFTNSNYAPQDHLMEEALHTFEMLMSYMNISARRICDTVPMSILFYMVRELCETIRAKIWTLLMEDPTRLLSEDPELATRRQSLRKKAERLSTAQRELQKF